MGRKPGSKNKKTVLKEKKINAIKVDHKPDPIPKKIEVIINEDGVEEVISGENTTTLEIRDRFALREFNLEKNIHDQFINKISLIGDADIYESFIMNEIMKQYVNGDVVLTNIENEKMYDFMRSYNSIIREPDFNNESSDKLEFRAANRLLSKATNGFIQYKYTVCVDPDVKISMMTFPVNTSYAMNELLKLYISDKIKINFDTVDKFKRTYKRIINKQSKDGEP